MLEILYDIIYVFLDGPRNNISALHDFLTNDETNGIYLFCNLRSVLRKKLKFKMGQIDVSFYKTLINDKSCYVYKAHYAV